MNYFQSLTPNFGFTISPYYKYISNFIQLIPIGTTTTVRGAFPVWEHNQTNAQIFGVDLDLNKTVLQQNRFPDYNFNTFNAILQQDVFVDISATPPTYTLFNFNSSATFKVFKSGTMKVDFNVENVFNISYRDSYLHPKQFRR